MKDRDGMKLRLNNDRDVDLSLILDSKSFPSFVTYICRGGGKWSPIYVSKNILDFGFTREEFLEKTDFWINHIHPDDQQKFLNELSDVFEKGFHTREYRVLDKNGCYRWVKDERRLIYDEDRKTDRYIGFIYDITREKKLEESLLEAEKRFEDILSVSADWFWEVDKNGVYTFVAGKVEEILGYKPEELIGRTPSDLMPEDEAGRIEEIFKEIAGEKKRIMNLENWNITKQGRRICLLTNGVPLLDREGNLIGYRGVDKDVTDIKLAEIERENQVERIKRYQSAIVKISTDELMIEGKFDIFCQHVTEVIAHAMEVERVSIWLLNDGQTELRCIDLYERSKDKHSKDITLSVNNYPNYFNTLRNTTAIDAEDALNDDRTKEFKEDYLIPLGIVSMLDATIRVHGKTRGVVCHEHIGEKRKWLPDEIIFAGEVSDQIANALLTSERIYTIKELEQRMKELELFQSFTEERELKMIELKREINELCEKYGEKPRYEIVDELKEEVVLNP